MRREPFENKMRSRAESFQHSRKFIQGHAQPAHPCIHFQMHSLAHRSGRCGILQRLDVPRLPYRGSEPQAHDLAFFAAPETRHQQNPRLDTRLAQRDRLIERCNAQPLRAFRLQSARAFHGTVAVSVGFHHRAHGHPRSCMFHNRAEVLPQSSQRNFRPCGSGGHAAQNFCSCRHWARL